MQRLFGQQSLHVAKSSNYTDQRSTALRKQLRTGLLDAEWYLTASLVGSLGPPSGSKGLHYPAVTVTRTSTDKKFLFR